MVSNNNFQPEGNYYDKYNSKNPVVRYIMGNFFKSMEKLIGSLEYNSVFDAGCGEGNVTSFIYKIRRKIKIEAMDISEKVINEAKQNLPNIKFHCGSITNIDRESNSYDLVVASEVLEHLEAPEIAMGEIFRISKKYVFISVPNEPVWRIGNLLRGKYIRNFGNTPGHIQHWSKKEIITLAKKYGNILKVSNPFPWTMVLCQKKI